MTQVYLLPGKSTKQQAHLLSGECPVEAAFNSPADGSCGGSFADKYGASHDDGCDFSVRSRCREAESVHWVNEIQKCLIMFTLLKLAGVLSPIRCTPEVPASPHASTARHNQQRLRRDSGPSDKRFEAFYYSTGIRRFREKRFRV